MKVFSNCLKFALIVIPALVLGGGRQALTQVRPVRPAPPKARLRAAALLRLPGVTQDGRADVVDSNSPVHWDSSGQLHVFTSAGHPYRSTGPDLFNLSRPVERVRVSTDLNFDGRRWLEATYRDDLGGLYGWYHNEPTNVCADRDELTAPRIGVMVSYNEGLDWGDLGLILDSPPGSLDCDTRNFYFAGGTGDFSVILDQEKKYFYFFISTYYGDVAEQGIAVARMAYEDRYDPRGKIRKWHNGKWKESGLGGRVTPIFPSAIDWERDDANSFWGPAIHYNTYLKEYVMLLNHAVNRYWAQEGIYISFSRDLRDPTGWSQPQRILEGGEFYPQVIGTGSGETDRLAGRVARFFLSGASRWEIVFETPDDQRRVPSRDF